jgi:hypothetical protein
MRKEPKKRSNSTGRRSTVDAYESIVRRRKIVRHDPQGVHDPRAGRLAGVRVVATMVEMGVVATVAVATLGVARVPVAIDRLLLLHLRATAIEIATVEDHLLVPGGHVAPGPATVAVGEISAVTIGAMASETAASGAGAAAHPRARVAVVVRAAVVVAVAAKITRTDRPAAASTISTTGNRSS